MFIIYRDKKTNQIKKYSTLKEEQISKVQENISIYNKDSQEFIVEIVENQDFKSLLEIAEENKKVKKSCLKSIEESIDMLRDDFYDLTRDLK